MSSRVESFDSSITSAGSPLSCARSPGNFCAAATSVGANLEEASAAQSKPDFISKCSIAAKEARETRYWLRLLIAAKGVSKERLTPLIEESDELVAILTTILKKAATSSNRGHSTFNIQH